MYKVKSNNINIIEINVFTLLKLDVHIWKVQFETSLELFRRMVLDGICAKFPYEYCNYHTIETGHRIEKSRQSFMVTNSNWNINGFWNRKK